MKSFSIPIEVYNKEIEVVIDCSQKELGDYLSKKHRGMRFEETKGNAGEFFEIECSCSHDAHYVIWIEDMGSSVGALDTLGHEAIHAASAILDDIGMVYDREKNDEVLAYLWSFIFRKALRQIVPYNKKKCLQKAKPRRSASTAARVKKSSPRPT